MTDNPYDRSDRPRTIAELVEAAKSAQPAELPHEDPLALAPKAVDGLGDEAHFQAVSTEKGILLTIFIPHTDLFTVQINPPADE